MQSKTPEQKSNQKLHQKYAGTGNTSINASGAKTKTDLLSPKNFKQTKGSSNISSTSRSPKQSFKNDQIRNVKLDLHNQKVIKADSSRSKFISSEHFDKLQMLLTYFCKTENLSYK